MKKHQPGEVYPINEHASYAAGFAAEQEQINLFLANRAAQKAAELEVFKAEMAKLQKTNDDLLRQVNDLSQQITELKAAEVEQPGE